MTTDQDAAADPRQTGMDLGLWIEAKARPQLRRWGRSGDDRVKLLAGVLTDLLETAVSAGDLDALHALHTAWTTQAAKIAADAPPL